jgi:hypothetical protein
MNPVIKICALAILTIGLFSCNRVKKKAEDVADRVKEKARKELETHTQRVIDKVFPPFDYDKPDTENNKQRFRDFIKVELSPDVKNIYCFDDAVGIDADYMFAFECDPATSEKIIETNHLTIDTVNMDNAFGLQDDLPWWDKKRIEQLQKYSWTDGKQYFKYYWYDRENKKAYFFDFDM